MSALSMLMRRRFGVKVYETRRRNVWLTLAVAAWLPTSSAQDNSRPTTILTADQIVAAMVSRNEARTEALQGYVGHRIYKIQYQGFPSDRSAEMTVAVRYTAPADEQFTVLSETGSKFIIDHVLRGLLSGEQESHNPANRRETALTPSNYRFKFVGQENTGTRSLYVLEVQPRVKNKFVYRGRIWVDTTDFAVVKIEAEPAKNPSFWISHTRIEQKYAKFGSFWLPVQNTSISTIRMLHGTATLSIQYQDYSLGESPTPAQASAHTAKRSESE